MAGAIRKARHAFATAHDPAKSSAPTVTGPLDAFEQVYREDNYLLAETTSIVNPDTGDRAIVVREGHVERIEIVGFEDDTARRIESYSLPLVGRKSLHSAEVSQAMPLRSATSLT